MKLFEDFMAEWAVVDTDGDHAWEEVLKNNNTLSPEAIKKFQEKYKQINGDNNVYISESDWNEASLTNKNTNVNKPENPAIKEEIFTTCLNYLRNHTKEELYETVSLAFLAASTFGYIKEEDDAV